MIGELHSYVLDCPNPHALAEFYRGILGGRIEIESEAWVNLVLPGIGSKLAFQQCHGYIAPVWPGDDGDQQAHLDIWVADLDVAHEQLLSLGAHFKQSHDGFRVYLDPAGHPFCTVD